MDHTELAAKITDLNIESNELMRDLLELMLTADPKTSIVTVCRIYRLFEKNFPLESHGAMLTAKIIDDANAGTDAAHSIN